MWRNGGSGGNFSAIPPQASLPPCWVIKNGVLIFREKWAGNEFLRTFETFWECVRKKSVGLRWWGYKVIRRFRIISYMLANYADLVNYEKIKTYSAVIAVIAVLAVLKTAITAKTAETARYIQRIYSLIFREKTLRNGFLRTFYYYLWMCLQEVRRKNVHGVNLLIFNITNLIFLIRFLRIFRISRICLTPKFSKFSKDSNWLLITHHSDLFPPIPPRYHSEGISKG